MNSLYLIKMKDINIEIPKELIKSKNHNLLRVDLLKGKSIIGFCGYSKSGKDNSAEIIENYGYSRISFGDTLKIELNKYARELTSKDLYKKNILLHHDDIDFLVNQGETKEILRPYMIYFSEMVKKINGENFWVNTTFEKYLDFQKLAISDIRRENELEIFEGNEFTINRRKNFLKSLGLIENQFIEPYKQDYSAILILVSKYEHEDKDELTQKAIRIAHEKWLFSDYIFVDTSIPEIGDYRRKSFEYQITNILNKHGLK